ncbi:MAG: small subunit ribosomal protein S17 [Hyphomicrobiaceae bacterium]|jgi:small subunit ribosomal protein S17
MSELETNRTQPRTREGVVVSDAPEKTAVVKVKRRVQHPRYKKFVQISEKYMVHDEHNEAAVGDRVIIAESRPMSARKRWRLRAVLEKAIKDVPHGQ